MVVQIKSMGFLGMKAYDINVETNLSRDIASFYMVGLPDISVKEARDRVHSAIVNCGFEFPKYRIVVNLAPADIKKRGAYYDLPILVSILCATGALNRQPDNAAFIGELSLSGEVRPVNGILPMTIQAKKNGIRQFYVPYDNASEGAVVEGIDIIPVKHVSELVSHLREKKTIPPMPHTLPAPKDFLYPVDFSDVKGQSVPKRALEIAAAGSHNVLFIGSPGAGKSMLAKRIPTILPDMTFDEMIETTKIHSIAGTLSKDSPLMTHRPFRSPHHTISPHGLSGGGSIPHPGEISLAHNGVLFLDELPEFKRESMEILRQPIEDGAVTISRVNATFTYPCTIMLIAAMNPCPCGYFGHPNKTCTCSRQSISRYLSKISGPLLDRLDLHVEVSPVEFESLSSKQQEESSSAIKERVNAARKIQNDRFSGTGVSCNSRIPDGMLQKFCPVNDAAAAIMKNAFDKLGLSARAYGRILKVARTIADMDSSEVIRHTHLLEAIQYRTLDRKYWKN